MIFIQIFALPKSLQICRPVARVPHAPTPPYASAISTWVRTPNEAGRQQGYTPLHWLSDLLLMQTKEFQLLYSDIIRPQSTSCHTQSTVACSSRMLNDCLPGFFSCQFLIPVLCPDTLQMCHPLCCLPRVVLFSFKCVMFKG